MSALRILRAAEVDLQEILITIAEDSFEIADAYLDKLLVRCEMLAQNPLIGVERPEISHGLRVFPVDDYLIFYRPHGDGVTIHRIVHRARDVSRFEFDEQ